MGAHADPRADEERVRHLETRPVRPGNDPSLTPLATAVILVGLVGLAVLKPWGEPPEPPRGQRPALTAAVETIPASVAPTPLSARDLAEPICLGAGAWRVASLERWRTQDVRVWRAIEPVPTARGPLDPAIPSAPIVAVELLALGWCAPAYGPASPVGPSLVSAWAVADGVATPLSLVVVQPPGMETPLAALYQLRAPCLPRVPCPPDFTRPSSEPWRAGRVVFRYEDVGAGRVGWFAAEVELLALDEGGLSGGAAPGASRTSPGPG